VQIAQGQLQAALRTYQDAMRHADAAPDQGRAYLSWAYVGMGQIYYERNELDEAARYLEVGQRSQEQIGDAGNLAACYITLAKLRAALGDCAGALDTAQRAQQASAHWNWTQLELNVAAQQARLSLRCGDLPAVERWIAQRQLGPNNAVPGWREVEYLTLARALIALQAPEQATSLLERLVQGAEAAGRIASLIEGLLALAVAQHARGDPRAMATLQRALALAEPEGYVRTFVDEGAPVAVLLRDAHAHGIVPNYVAWLLAAFGEGLEARDLGLADALPASSRGALWAPQASTLVEPLTDRELEVLRLLAEGLSNQEIGAALVLALGTVKRHTNSIYGKLGVRSRMQAVVRARELALL
jgi:LuxR family maltose regulon positive regulatory protein